MKAVLLGSRNGGLERVEALNARARSAGLVEFVLVIDMLFVLVQ